jgi:hypothetical protein
MSIPQPPPPPTIPLRVKKGHKGVMVIIILSVIVVSVFGWTSCEIKKISVSLAGVPSIYFGWEGVTIRATLSLQNYGGLEARVLGGQFSIYVSGQYLGSGNIGGVYLSAHSTSYVQLTIEISWGNMVASVAAILRDIWHGWHITASISGEIYVQAFIFSVSIPFTQTWAA